MHIVTEKAKHFCGDPELLAHRMTCRGVPGCSVALLQGGQVTHSAVSGAAGAAPVTEGTLFECASLTKPLFAVLALQLADERLLALDESVPARLGGEPWSQDPDFAKIPPPRQILSHSSGLPDWHSRPMPMLFAPGTAYSYSGQGYYLLQHLAEKLRDNLSRSCLRAMLSRPFKCTAPPCFGRRGWAAPFLRALMRRAILAACGIVWI